MWLPSSARPGAGRARPAGRISSAARRVNVIARNCRPKSPARRPDGRSGGSASWSCPSRPRDDQQRPVGRRRGPLVRIQPVEHRSRHRQGTGCIQCPGRSTRPAPNLAAATRRGAQRPDPSRRRMPARAGVSGRLRPRRGRRPRSEVPSGRSRANSPASSSSPGWNSRIVPYSPSYPASLITSLRRSRAMPSPSSEPPTRLMSSSGTSRRMPSSGPSAATSRLDLAGHLLALRPGGQDLAHDLGQLDQAGDTPRRRAAGIPAGRSAKLRHPVQHADGQRLAARPGTRPWRTRSRSGSTPDLALAVPVEVILPLLGKELEGAASPSPGPQRGSHGEVVKRAYRTPSPRGRASAASARRSC